MSDNVLQTLQHLVQDVIAPDVRELKANQAAMDKNMNVRFEAADQKSGARFDAIAARFDAIEQRLAASDQKSDARFDSLMSAISESRAQAELTNLRVIAALSERVAVLEAQRH